VPKRALLLELENMLQSQDVMARPQATALAAFVSRAGRMSNLPLPHALHYSTAENLREQII